MKTIKMADTRTLSRSPMQS